MIKSKKFENVARAIEKSDSFLIFAHKNPDGDAVGSCVALGLMLKALGKKADYAIDRDSLSFYSLFEEGGNFSKEITGKYDAAIAIDCSTLSYIDKSENLERCSSLILIDHHASNEGYGDYDYVDSQAAATGEIVFDFIRHFNVSITSQMADALFLAISTDTGNFAYPNTTARTHEIIAGIYPFSNNFTDIIGFINKYDISKLELMKAAIDSIKFYYDNKMAVISITQDKIKITPQTDTDRIIDLVKNVRGCLISVLIKEVIPDEFKISLRSDAGEVDVSKLAMRLGGGGHMRAAGFNVNGTYEDALEKVLNVTKDIWTES